MQVQPYLNFDGKCEEAIEFYRSALGAEVTALMRFKEMPPTEASDDNCMVAPGSEEKIMHAALRIGETLVLASDCACQNSTSFQGISLALDLESDVEAQKVFSALSEGGQVQMPLSATFFASSFGMVADRFGVSWTVVVSPK